MSELGTLPILGSDDIARSTAFYCDVLGFEKAYQWPAEGDAEFVALKRGPWSVGIGSYDPPPQLPDRPMRPQGPGRGLTLCVYVHDVDATLEAVRGFPGAAVLTDGIDQPWGERMAFVTDPDDTLIVLTAPL